LDRLTKLYHAYKGQVSFVFIYVKEGHHQGLLPMPKNLDHKPLPGVNGWLVRIRHGIEYFHLPFRCLVDNSDHAVEKAYGAFPARLVIVDTRGRIALDEGIGVMGPRWNHERIENCLKNDLH
jgi:hypothetical protein